MPVAGQGLSNHSLPQPAPALGPWAPGRTVLLEYQRPGLGYGPQRRSGRPRFGRLGVQADGQGGGITGQGLAADSEDDRDHPSPLALLASATPRPDIRARPAASESRAAQAASARTRIRVALACNSVSADHLAATSSDTESPVLPPRLAAWHRDRLTPNRDRRPGRLGRACESLWVLVGRSVRLLSPSPSPRQPSLAGSPPGPESAVEPGLESL